MNATADASATSLLEAFRLARPETEIPEASPSEEPAVPAPEPVVKRILLADDDPGVREMLGRVLASAKHEVLFARTGREAAAKMIADPPDLVLLDLNMPDKDGWQAFQAMCERHPLVPVIVITARPDQYRRAADLGVDALMEKPLDLAILLQAVETLLAESEADRTRRLTSPYFQTVFLNPPTHRLAGAVRA